MIVVAIIGILSSIAMPQFATSLTRAKEKARIANKETVRSALYQAFANTGSWPGAVATWNCIGPAGATCWTGAYPATAAVTSAISPYLPNPPAMNVPTTSLGYNGIMYACDANTVGWGAVHGPAMMWPMEPGSPDSDCTGSPSPVSWITADAQAAPAGYRICFELISNL
jgi:type II secretory pathway pseudopilin PulG